MPKKELKDPKEIDVAKGFKELEEIAAWFERGEADLDQGLMKFERAMVVAEALKQRLSLAENKVKDIKKKFNVE
ncbi:MAG: exodeoxyribonuclease VII small subunit [Patescibacteria group bacterium]